MRHKGFVLVKFMEKCSEKKWYKFCGQDIHTPHKEKQLVLGRLI